MANEVGVGGPPSAGRSAELCYSSSDSPMGNVNVTPTLVQRLESLHRRSIVLDFSFVISLISDRLLNEEYRGQVTGRVKGTIRSHTVTSERISSFCRSCKLFKA